MSRADSPLRDRMIFNVGARRSGTFWLQRVVTAHPQIAAVPSETHLFFGIADLFERLHHGARSSPQVGAVYVEPDALRDAARDLCDTVFATHLEPGVRYVAERTPIHALKLDLIDEIYPDARVVHIIRDGRDAARSLAAQDFGPARVADAAAEWREVVETARAASLPPERYLEVRYEDLLADPDQTVIGIYEWLGLDASAGIAANAVAESRSQVNVDRFEIGGVAAGKWEEAFTPQDLEAFEAVAGALLAELGYPPGEGRRQRSRGRPRLRGKARRALRRLRGEETEEARQRSRIAHRQTIADRFLESLRSGDLSSAGDLLHPDMRVSVVDAQGRREARGVAGVDLLAEAAAADPVLAARQVVGDVHASLPTIAYVLSLDDGGKGRQDRLVLVTVPGQRVAAVTIYRFPLGSPG